jgi:hypothetical protein
MNLSPEERAVQESQAIGQVVEHMATRFPEIDRGLISEVVDEEYDTFAGHPVRDYVPVLVERQVKGRLRSGLTRSLESAEA